jgi:hypothetical protein
MKHAVEKASGGMIQIRPFMLISLGIQVTLTLLPQQFERQYSWYYQWNGIIKSAAELASYDKIYMSSFMKIGTGVQGRSQ